MTESENLVFRDISQVVTMAGVAKKKGRKPTEQDLGVIENASVVVDTQSNKILWVGTTDQLPSEHQQCPNVQSREGFVWLPEFVECHTHLVFAGNRYDDFNKRCSGQSYQQVAAAGGGILSTLKNTRLASKEELLERALKEIDRFQKFGVGTIEVKTGYGLTLEQEIKMLEVIEELRFQTAMLVIPTFMPAHMTPPEFAGRTNDYVKVICEEWIPEVAKRESAAFFDVFVEDGYFNLQQTRKLCEVAIAHGFRIKLHVEQFVDLDGTALGVELGATSVDHLDHISDSNIQKLAASETVGVLLPGASLFTGTPYPPARKLIDAGARIAVSSDYNPGTCPSRNLPLMTTLACTQMQMTIAESLAAITYNAAAALGVADRVGTIEVGREFRVCQLQEQSYKSIPYCFGELA